MAYQVNTRSFVGNGQIYVGPRAGVLTAIGNASSLTFSFEEETLREPDYTRGGGGTRNSQSRITRASGATSIYDYSPGNLVIALRGTSTAVSAAAVTDETHTAKKGSLIPLVHLADPDEDITVKIGNDTITPTGNYTVTSSGIKILAAATDIDDDDSLKITYTKHASYEIEALTQSGQEYRLYFEGLNDFDTGEPVFVDFFRVKFAPVETVGLIGAELLTLDLSFEILADTTITEAGKSQYFRIVMTDNPA